MELQSRYDDITDAGAEVLAISTDDLTGASDIIRQSSVDFPILYSNTDPSVPQAYNVFDLFGDGRASASVFIVDTDGNLAYSNIGKNYRHQVSAETVLAALDNIN